MGRLSAGAGSARTLFQAVLNNRTDGASALFEQFVQLARQQPHETVLAGLQACRRTFPLMAVWPYALDRLSEREQDLEQTATYMARQTQTTVARAAAALEELPGQGHRAVLTLSNSSVVRRAILTANAPMQVLCAASHPGGEGRLLARALQEAGARATLVADEQLPQKLAEVQAVVLGADQYDESGFINKVGSRGLARQARHLAKPVLVLAERFKRVDRLPELTPELAALEIEEGGRVSRQTVFEWVPWQPHIRLIAG